MGYNGKDPQIIKIEATTDAGLRQEVDFISSQMAQIMNRLNLLENGEYIPPEDTTAPVLTITPGGTFTGTKTVSMSTNENADIFYTTNGTTPTTSSTKYTTPLSISNTITLKAFAKDTAGNQSSVQTVIYTFSTQTDTTPPTDVTNLQAVNVAESSTTLIWTLSEKAKSYDIKKDGIMLTNVTGSTYEADNLTPNSQYTFTVIAKNTIGSSEGVNVTLTTLTIPIGNEPAYLWTGGME